MILLEFHNRIIYDTLMERLGAEKQDSMDAVIADFDGVTFHLATDPNSKNLLTISVSIKCFSDLKNYGVEDHLKKTYGEHVTTPEGGYDYSLKIDCSKAPANKAEFAKKCALLKRNCFAAPFYKACADIEAKKASELIEINYRDEEALYLKSDGERLTVIFSINFKDPNDIVYAKVFLQEYADARRTLNNAPAVNYSQKEPPMELKSAKNLRIGDNMGFVSFVLFQPHVQVKKREASIDSIQTFRNYLHYHLKCSKAYLHTRMRNQVRTFLQVLNRSKSEPASTEKKTITGRTFRRADDPPSNAPDFNI